MFDNEGKLKEQIALTIGLKYNQIKRESLPNLEVTHFIDYLFNFHWKKGYPNSLTLAITEIMNTNVEKMVVYLSNNALIQSKNYSLDQFDDLFVNHHE